MTWNPNAKRFSYLPTEQTVLLGNRTVEVHRIVQIKLRETARYLALWKNRPHPWLAATQVEPDNIVHYAGSQIVFMDGPESLRCAGYLSGLDVRNLHLHLFYTLRYTTNSQLATINRRYNKLKASIPSVHGSMRDNEVYLYFQSEADLTAGREHYKRAVVAPPLPEPE